LDLESVQQLVDFATGGLKPDITLFFDITPEEGIRRRKGVEEFNRLDAKALEYHHRVYKGYQELIAQEPDRWIVIDASKSIEEVHEDVVREVMTRLAMGRPT
jgi:dTMP kinase